MEQNKFTERLKEGVNSVSRVVTDVVHRVKRKAKDAVEHKIVKPNREVVAEWKTEVDKFVEALQNKNLKALGELMRRQNTAKGQHEMSGDPNIIMHRVIEDGLDEKAIKLMAISLFVLREKPSWNPRKALFKILKGQVMDFSKLKNPENEAETMHCWDVSAWVKELASEYGIDGEIKTVEPLAAGSQINSLTRPIQHAYFTTSDHRVIDPMHGWEHGGYYKEEDEFVNHYRGQSFSEQIGVSRNSEKKTPFSPDELGSESFKLLNKADEFELNPSEVARSILWSSARKYSSGKMWNVFSADGGKFVLKTGKRFGKDENLDKYRRKKLAEYPDVRAILGKEFTLPQAAFEVGDKGKYCIFQQKLDMKDWQVISTRNIDNVFKSDNGNLKLFRANADIVKDFISRAEKLYAEKGLMIDVGLDNIVFRVVDGKLELKLVDPDCFSKDFDMQSKINIKFSEIFLKKLKKYVS